MNKTLRHIILSALLLLSVAVMAQDPPQRVTVQGNVFGGGNKAPVAGKSTVLIDQDTATIGGSVYGGGALADVGTQDKVDTTSVTILKGIIEHDVYGGGLGDSIVRNENNQIHVLYNGDTCVAAFVYNKVYVNIGSETSGHATIRGSVFGCNNINGTPLDSVFVNIYQTAHTTDNDYPSAPLGIDDLESQSHEPNYDDNFAINAVYGGGNKASYKPNLNTDNTPKCTTVHVWGCEENTIKTIYGGGNAANVGDTVHNGSDIDTTRANTRLIIDGGRFDQIFGGGNGYSSTNPANHNNAFVDGYNPGANIYGTATTIIESGYYRQVFGGSNQCGDLEKMALTIERQGCDTLLIYESFGGGNEADIHGDVTTTLACGDYKIGNFYGGSNLADITGDVTLNVAGGNFVNVFGGSKGTSPKAANINGNVTLNLTGGIMTNAFGGSDVNGNIKGVITVNVMDTVACSTLVVDTIYGGGCNAEYRPDSIPVTKQKIVSPVVNLLHGTVGENAGDIVTVAGCVFGGGKGSGANVIANPKVNIGDASSNTNQIKVLGHVFGGGNAAEVDGIDSVLMLNSNSKVVNLFGGGNKADADSAVVIMGVAATVDTIFGGGNLAGLQGTAEVIVSAGTVNGGVYGGSNKSGTVVGGITVSLEGGTVNDDVYGGGYGGDSNPDDETPEGTYTTGNIMVTLKNTAVVNGDLYGGSAFGSVNGNSSKTTVNLQNSNLHGKIFGGGKGQTGTSSYKAITNGNVEVNIEADNTNGNLMGVYGGANVNGIVKGDIQMNVTANVGTDDNNRIDVFGGGLGENTDTEGNVTVNIGTTNDTPTIYGDIYGGSALGNVNDKDNIGSDSTIVNILNGNLHGDVYGGGLGKKGSTSPSVDPIEAKVYGKVFVNIGSDNNGSYSGDATIHGNVFGCNNLNGSPLDSVFVNVYETAHSNTIPGYDTCPNINSLIALQQNAITQGYAIQSVYGGGNLAAYTPQLTSTNKPKSATVHVHTCENTVKEVYGGGNAADVGTSSVKANTFVVIDGGRISRVFGGGKGDNASNPRVAANIHGTATTTIYAGLIDTIFGGGNMEGSIDSISLVLDHSGSCTNEVFNQVYGGANLAELICDLNTTIKCGVDSIGDIYGGSNLADITGDVTLNIKGGKYHTVFGGSRGADGNGANIKDNTSTGKKEGNVTLNLFGGEMVNAFGGSNVEGNIQGLITVNVLDTVTGCSLQVDTIYGGGQDAAYTPNDLTPGVKPISPVVSLLKGTVGHGYVPGCVFGGGKGLTATVTANPKVYIGDTENAFDVAVTGNVYGGGNLAKVKGKTSVVVQKNSGVGASTTISHNVYGGGNKANISGSTEVEVTGGTVTEDVYGGGALAHVNVTDEGGSATHTTGANTSVTLSGGSVRTLYGGGMGQSTPSEVAALVYGNTTVTVSGGTITGNSIFGSGASAIKGGVFGGCNERGTVMGDAMVNINSAVGDFVADNHINIYGGGLGVNTNIKGSVAVTVDAGTDTIHGDVYGGSAKGLVNYEYGSTTTPSSSDTTGVTLTSGTVTGDLYGGGHGLDGASANVGGKVTVLAEGGIVSIYANGTKGGNIFGCNNALGAPQSTVRVDINRADGDTIATNVFGGGNLAAYAGVPDVNFINGAVDTIFGGGNRANVGGGDVTMIGGTVNGGVFGGCNASGTVNGNIVVNINAGTVGISDSLINSPNHIAANVFGGGYGESTATTGNVEVNIGEFTYDNEANEIHSDLPAIYGNVYGGSALGTINTVNGNDTTVVNIKNGNLIAFTGTEDGFDSYIGGNVFGGGLGEAGAVNVSKGQVNGAVIVNIGTGTLASSDPDITLPTAVLGKASIGGNVYGCNNTNGSPQKNVLVNVFQTHHTGPNDFAIHNVFGGGNKADFTATNMTTDVKIYTCYNTVERVFGGGNAAATQSVSTMIQGGRFAEVFGGGNGEVTAANVNGTVTLNIHGGEIGEFFGGSNQNGTISGVSTISVDDSGPCGPVTIEEFFCGGKYADFVGNIDAIISCAEGMNVKNLYGGCKEADVVPSGTSGQPGYKPGNVHLSVYGGTFKNVYGGSKGSLPPANATPEQLAAASADIAGDVTLDIYGGVIDTVFGGNNVFGNIFGKIVVNIMDNGSEDGCPLVVHNVYGGGRDAAYTPSADVASTGCYPEVNIIHGRVSLTPQLDLNGDTIVSNGQPVYIGGGKVFGGGYGQPAVVSHNPKVRIGYDASMYGYLPAGYIAENLMTATVDSLVFGGGDRAPVAGSTSVTIQKSSSSALGLFGGGNMASVGNATVDVLDGNVTAGVYGGCNVSGTVGGPIDSLTFAQGVNSENKKILEIDTIHSSFDGTIAVNLNGGTVGVNGTTTDVVFGGGYGHSTSTAGNIGVTLGTAANSGTTVYGNLYGGSALGSVNAANKTTTVTLTSATLHGSVFGGGMGSGSEEATKATSLGNATVNINVHDTNLTGIYGGANVNGDVAGDINVNVKANVGTDADNRLSVYGGGLGAATTTGGDVTVTVDKASGSSPAPTIYGDVYGGSAFGQVNGSSDTTRINFVDGTLYGALYGGGQGHIAAGDSAVVNGHVSVDVANGTINDGIYGGCKDKGGVTGDIAVNVNGGTIGGSTHHANLHGGGLGNKTATSGDVRVTFGQTGSSHSSNPELYGDIYGGSAEGHVNDKNHIGRDSTIVNVLNGNVYGHVYGGGLGKIAGNIKAIVNGKVFVNIGEENGNNPVGYAFLSDTTAVFGCNNANGSPQDSVFVNIYQTAHGNDPAHNAYPSDPPITTVEALANNSASQAYAIKAVYGGGNQAAYMPDTLADGNPRSATVHVYGCDKNTIKEVYGGGNAADVGTSSVKANTFVVIDGGRINRVFGGGKGVKNTTQANIFGTATTTINAGLIDTIFGGSNQNGSIDSTSLILTYSNETCAEIFNQVFGGANEAQIGSEGNEAHLATTINCGVGTIGDIYGGSNLADIQGDVTLNIKGGDYNNVFGGSRGAEGNGNGADISGNVELNLQGGNIVNAFGGSNINGNIGGKITVNVIDTVACSTLVVDTIYGGGQDASYEPSSLASGVYSPEVNLKQGTVGQGSVDAITVYGCVFGGGKGAGAVVTSNPKVIIGDDTYGPITVLGKVFGGGNEAVVEKATTILMQNNDSRVDTIFGGGNKANVTDSTFVTLNGGTVLYDVYGGGALANTGGANVILSGATVQQSIYGGGLGQLTPSPVPAEVTAEVRVTANAGLAKNVFGCNNVNGAPTDTVMVSLLGSAVVDSIFGGGNLAACELTPSVDISGGTVRHKVIGGGNQANIGGGYINITGGTIGTVANESNGVYGGCNTSGTVTGDIVVNVNGGTIGANGKPANVHGGGYGQNTKTGGNVEVTIDKTGTEEPVIWGAVYGGSALGSVNNITPSVNTLAHTYVTLSDGTVHGDIYGGGLGKVGVEAKVWSPVQVTVNGGTVTGSVYGCNNVNGAPQSTVNVDIYGTDAPSSGYALGHVFGGGNQATYSGIPEVKVHNCDNSIEYVYGGGNAAAVAGTDVTIYGGNTIGNVYGGCYGANVTDNGGTNVKIHGGKINNVFGGNNQSGSITGDIKVDIDKDGDTDPNGTSTACNMYIGAVYGGGNVAGSNAGEITIDCTGTLKANHYVYPQHIGDTLEGIGTVYGGANEANIGTNENPSHIVLNIKNGIINNVFGGNNTSGVIYGNIQVNIDSVGGCSPNWYLGNVFGGGNHAHYSGTPDVNIKNGTVSGNVFGGGNDITNDDPSNPTYGVLGSNVEMTGGTVLGGIYGGCNLKGSVLGNSNVTITSGTIGSQAQLTAGTVAQVFGGGLGVDTRVKGNVEVNIDSLANYPAPIIYGDVYGGSALGNVNDAATDHTTVNVLYGTLMTKNVPVNGFPVYHGGNVYGGGLGRKGGGELPAVEAKVYGTVTVNIGGPSSKSRTLNPDDDANIGNATIQGNVYGCNNTNGSPQDSVTVNIYRTHRKETDQINYVAVAGSPEATYALHNVFGGGNEADYIPATTAANKKLKVWIHNCYNSIERVFGGSNAAAAGAAQDSVVVNTVIDGGRFNAVFGGGNGEVSAANIIGNVDLQIHGGMVNEFFVGSNQNGSISGSSNVVLDQSSGCEEINITEFFCGGKYANFVGNIDATITCSEGMHVTNLYGGCKEAHVTHKGVINTEGYEPGNIHLKVYGGTFENVYGGSKGTTEKGADIEGDVLLEIFGGTVTNAIFGGSNVKGAIGGSITVNVEQGSGPDYCPLDVSLADVYGGGNQANYPGTPASDSPITPPNTHPSSYNFPQVNIKNATVKNVFGGGLKATVTGNPQIKIKKGSKILGNVYGGGNMGEVNGDPRVIINGKME